MHICRHIALDCIRDFFSDGTSRVREPIVTDNGLVYKIDRVLTVGEGRDGGHDVGRDGT